MIGLLLVSYLFGDWQPRLPGLLVGSILLALLVVAAPAMPSTAVATAASWLAAR